jgi:purine-binding chemotaxis protein CheW
MPALASAAAAAAPRIDAEPSAVARGGTYLVFALGGEEYAVDVTRVREIIGAMPITRVPCMPEAVLGVINLRGKIIPVVDLRVRFGLEAVDHGQRTCIIIVQAAGAEFGAVVDRVAEVAAITADEIEDPPAFAAGVATDHLLGLARHGARVRLLLDIERTLSRQSTTAIAALAETAAV